VQLPGITDPPAARINTAYHYGEYYQVPGGGPEELRATIAGTFNLRLDRYVVVNFLAFEQGVDAIGGVDLDLPAPLQDASYPLRDGSGTIAVNFPAGPIHMDGATALIYARIRHDSNDINRMKRQQQVLFAIRDKLLLPETIPQLPALAQVLLTAVRTDLTLDDIALLGCLGPQINREAIQAWVIDTTMVTPTKFADGAQVLMPNMDAIAPILEAFNTGE
jgi:LCP family protein required for cell wall assembly